jgi:hypothetical protein
MTRFRRRRGHTVVIVDAATFVPSGSFASADYARDAINRNDSSPLDVHVNAGVRGNASPKPWPIWRLCVEVTLSLG